MCAYINSIRNNIFISNDIKYYRDTNKCTSKLLISSMINKNECVN